MGKDHYRVRITETAKDDLRRIGKKYGRRSYEVLRELIRDLELEPEKKGESLRGSLRGLYSRHYSRFRVIYRIQRKELVVIVVGCGFHESRSRVDVYKAIERMIASGSLELGEPPADDKEN